MHEFERRILALEQEVRSLKTAHRRGLASIDFGTNKIAVETSASNGIYVKMTGNNRRTFPFLVQLAAPQDFFAKNTTRPIEISEEDNSITLYMKPFRDPSGGEYPEIKIVATDSIVVESGQE